MVLGARRPPVDIVGAATNDRNVRVSVAGYDAVVIDTDWLDDDLVAFMASCPVPVVV